MKVYITGTGEMLCGQCAARRDPAEPGSDEVAMELEYVRGVRQNCGGCRQPLTLDIVDEDPRPR